MDATAKRAFFHILMCGVLDSECPSQCKQKYVYGTQSWIGRDLCLLEVAFLLWPFIFRAPLLPQTGAFGEV